MTLPAHRFAVDATWPHRLARVEVDLDHGVIRFLVEAARRDYGIVITVHGRHCDLDVEATKALRRELAGKNG